MLGSCHQSLLCACARLRAAWWGVGISAAGYHIPAGMMRVSLTLTAHRSLDTLPCPAGAMSRHFWKQNTSDRTSRVLAARLMGLCIRGGPGARAATSEVRSLMISDVPNVPLNEVC